MENGADPNLPLLDFAHQPTFIAISTGNLEILKILLPKIEISTSTINRLYMAATIYSLEDILKFLIQSDKNENKKETFFEYIQSFPNKSVMMDFFEKCYNDNNE